MLLIKKDFEAHVTGPIEKYVSGMFDFLKGPTKLED